MPTFLQTIPQIYIPSTKIIVIHTPLSITPIARHGIGSVARRKPMSQSRRPIPISIRRRSSKQTKLYASARRARFSSPLVLYSFSIGNSARVDGRHDAANFPGRNTFFEEQVPPCEQHNLVPQSKFAERRKSLARVKVFHRWKEAFRESILYIIFVLIRAKCSRVRNCEIEPSSDWMVYRSCCRGESLILVSRIFVRLFIYSRFNWVLHDVLL